MIRFRDTLQKFLKADGWVLVTHRASGTKAYSLEPDGCPLYDVLVEKMIEDGALIPIDDGLIPGSPQTYRFVEVAT